MSLLHYMYILKTKIIQCIFVPLFEHHPIERRKFIHTVLRYSSAECTVLLMSFVGKRYFATVALTVLGQTCPQQLFCRVWGPEPQRQFYLVPWDWMTLWFQKTCDRQWGQPNNTGTVSWKPKKNAGFVDSEQRSWMRSKVLSRCNRREDRLYKKLPQMEPLKEHDFPPPLSRHQETHCQECPVSSFP